MNQDEMIAKLAPAIGLRRQLDPRTDQARQVLRIRARIRPLQPAERTFSDETLDTIMVEHAIDAGMNTLRPARRLRQRPCVDLVSRSDHDHHPPARRGHQRPDRPGDLLCPDLRRHNAADHSRHRRRPKPPTPGATRISPTLTAASGVRPRTRERMPCPTLFDVLRLSQTRSAPNASARDLSQTLTRHNRRNVRPRYSKLASKPQWGSKPRPGHATDG